MRIVVLGSTGMIGHKIYLLLSKNKNLQLFNFSKSKLNDETRIVDLREQRDISRSLDNIKPNVVINAAGLLIQNSDKNPIDAVKLNAVLPLSLAKLSKNLEFKLIQISTDCVFSGKNGPYSRFDSKDSSTIYGKTKSLGEIYDDNNLTIRTSVIGPDLKPDGKELFSWFMGKKGRIDGFSKSMWSGVTTLELAKCVESCIVENVSGLHHLSSGTPISKYNLLKIINDENGNRIQINNIDGPINNKVLINDESFFYAKPQNYKSLVRNMMIDIFESRLYPHLENR